MNITVNLCPRVLAGSCNACQTRDDPLVFSLDTKTSSIRLCHACVKELQQAIKPAMKHYGRRAQKAASPPSPSHETR